SKAAEILALIGDFDLQEQILLQLLERVPDDLAARVELAFLPKHKLKESDVAVLEKAIADPEVNSDRRSQVGFALGSHFHNLKQYDKAFAYYRQGNDLRGYHWDRAGYRNWVNRTCDIYTREFFAQRVGWGSGSRMPVLIVGMPRSGTTLTEQILSSHSDVHGAGELGAVRGLASSRDVAAPNVVQDPASVLGVDAGGCAAMAANYLQRIGSQTRHGEHLVTNKLPHNFQQLGLFALLFPRAPVIHIQREPLDNLLSIYFQDFAAYHPYAYDLKDLAVQYWEQERLMTHWKSVVPNPVFSLQYEELVADLPGMIRRLTDFVGIDAEESMQRFHEHRREVRTASQWQVRQQLYSSSVGRWKAYEKHLKPLIDALEEFAPHA
ncbi:MAG: sulfotransferase, partial [Halieaceae bacterium]|nr:sulfotransferase [Halieaceae bacterium]